MRALLLTLTLLLTGAEAAADSSSATFGSVENTPILWEPPKNAELTSEALRFTQQGSEARSQPLPLQPNHYYRIHTKMARGPGSTIQFSISYLDANKKPVEWIPNWQLKHATHANWLPLSPSLQHYIQGFVLPLGATQPRLELKLEKTETSHSRWELTELNIHPISAATSCKKLSPNRQLGGDFEGTPHDGLPAFWVKWSPNVELIDTRTACKHVLRIPAASKALVASSYQIPVTPGSVHQISVRARGRGRIQLDAHSLSRDRPNPQRVGNSTRPLHTFELASDKWTQLIQPWFAEAPNVTSAQVMIAVDADSEIELDAAELHSCISSL